MRKIEVIIHGDDSVTIYGSLGQVICENVPGSVLLTAPEMLKKLVSVSNYLDGLKGPRNHELLNIQDTIWAAKGCK